MSSKEEKEKQQQVLEMARRKRDKHRAITKASNEMLDEAVVLVKDRLKDTPDSMNEIVDQIDNAKKENLDWALKNLGSNEEDIKSAKYGEPSQIEIEKYNKHLKKLGITDEEMHNKALITANGGVEAVSNKKKKGKSLKSFQKNKFNEDSSINQEERTVEGVGYVKNEEPIKNVKINQPDGTIERKNREKTNIDNSYIKFDPSTIPNGVEWDMVTLPSKGECYPSKCSRLPVRSLNASDEDIIMSPNLYVDGKVTDVILKRCILDKNFDVDSLCKGDRDAILIWLRADAYGVDFPVTVKHPVTDKEYNSNVNLGNLVEKYVDFDLKGDENGYFKYVDGNGNDIRYRLLTKQDFDEIQRELKASYARVEKIEIEDCINKIQNDVTTVFSSEEDYDETLIDAINYIKNWNNNLFLEVKKDELTYNAVTTHMIRYTVSVNGNTDRDFIKNFVYTMKAGEARKYRAYVNEHIPGIDFNINIEVPESDGGGSFETFLRLDDTIFINV